MEDNEDDFNQEEQINIHDKTGVGIILGILGLLGLIIGCSSYKPGTEERKTFKKAWTIAYIITKVITIILTVAIKG